MKPNWNEIAHEVAALEGKKVAVNIAQIKEVLRCFRIVLWRRYGNSASSWARLIADLVTRSVRDGEKWSQDNDSN